MWEFSFNLHDLHARKKYLHVFQFFAHTELSLDKEKKKRKAPREIRTYLLYATRPAPNPLHYSGRYCRTASYIRNSITITLLVPYSSVYSAKNMDYRSEIKLAYATPFELQGQKNTTISYQALVN